MHNGLKTQWEPSLTQPVVQWEENTSIHCSGKERSIRLLWPEIIVAACLLINDQPNLILYFNEHQFISCK